GRMWLQKTTNNDYSGISATFRHSHGAISDDGHRRCMSWAAMVRTRGTEVARHRLAEWRIETGTRHRREQIEDDVQSTPASHSHCVTMNYGDAVGEGLREAKNWGGRRESNLAPNVKSTTYRATGGIKVGFRTHKALLVAGDWQVNLTFPDQRPPRDRS